MECIVCNSKSSKIYSKDFYELNNNLYDLKKCLNCGFVYVSPFPSDKELKSMYNMDYFDDCYDSGLSNKGYFENESKMTDRYSKLIKKIQTYKTAGKLLEIGCAGGTFLDIAKRNNYEVFGVELSKDICEKTQNKNITIFNGNLEEANYETDFFDIVYMGHVLEHIPFPEDTIKEVKRILKKNGLIIIEVPCFVNSFYYIILKYFYKIFPLKPAPIFKIIPDGKYMKPYHLLEFSPKTIKMFLIKKNFDIIKLEQDIPMPDSILKKSKNIKELLIKIIFKSLNFLTKIKFRGGQLRVYAKNIK